MEKNILNQKILVKHLPASQISVVRRFQMLESNMENHTIHFDDKKIRFFEKN